MNVLILEDDSMRIEYFAKKLIHQNIAIVNNVRMFKSSINSFDFDFIFLDHDLGGAQYVDSSVVENTGYTASKLLASVEFIKLPFITIHSFNSIGAQNMYNILKPIYNRNVIVIPYGTEIFNDIVEQISLKA
jgi:hypothetical protein